MNKILYLNPCHCEDLLNNSHYLMSLLCKNSFLTLSIASAGSSCTHNSVIFLSKEIGSLIITLGASFNLQFHIPRNIPCTSLWITPQFPVFYSHKIYHNEKILFHYQTANKSICPLYLQAESEDESSLWLKSILCTVLQNCISAVQ